CPAAGASRTRSAGTVLEPASSVTSVGSRPAARAASAMFVLTLLRLSRTVMRSCVPRAFFFASPSFSLGTERPVGRQRIERVEILEHLAQRQPDDIGIGAADRAHERRRQALHRVAARLVLPLARADVALELRR